MKYTVELQKVIDNMDLSKLGIGELGMLAAYVETQSKNKLFSCMKPLRKEDLCDELKAEISNHVGKVVNADTGEIIQDDNGHITGVGLKSDPIQFSAASLNVSLGNKEDLVAMCRYENGKLEINNDMLGELKAETIKADAIPTTHVQPGISFKALDNAIKNERAAREAADKKLAKSVQEQEFKTVEQRKYDAVIADVTRSLRYDYHILITFIDVQKMVDFFIDKGVKRGELDPYLYAAKESVKFIENLNK